MRMYLLVVLDPTTTPPSVRDIRVSSRPARASENEAALLWQDTIPGMPHDLPEAARRLMPWTQAYLEEGPAAAPTATPTVPAEVLPARAPFYGPGGE